jgi:hypothetical protein
MYNTMIIQPKLTSTRVVLALSDNLVIARLAVAAVAPRQVGATEAFSVAGSEALVGICTTETASNCSSLTVAGVPAC